MRLLKAEEMNQYNFEDDTLDVRVKIMLLTEGSKSLLGESWKLPKSS